MINNKTIRQVVINSKLFPCSGTSYHDVTGSICNFETDLAAPLKTCEVTVTPNQAAGTPTPSNPIPIYGHTGLNVVKCGANFFDETTERGTINDTTGQPTSSDTQIRSVDFCSCKGGATYYIKVGSNNSIRVFWYASDYTYLGQTQNIANATVTAPANARYFKIRGTNAYGTSYQNDISINYPSTDTTYHAYNTATTYPISWTDTVYGGSVDIISGTGISDYGYLVLDGSEDWDLYSPQYGFALSIEGMKNGSAMEGYSNFLPTITSSANFGIRFGGALVNNNIYCCRIIGEIEGVTDVESWKTYLSTNNLIICYPLAVPETLTLEPQTINTLEGINNIWNDAGETTVKYAASGGSCNGVMKFLPIFYPNGKGVKHHGNTF